MCDAVAKENVISGFIMTNVVSNFKSNVGFVFVRERKKRKKIGRRSPYAMVPRQGSVKRSLASVS